MFLDNEPDIDLVVECSCGEEALAAIEECPPDLLFLDVQMPGMNGFELLGKLPADCLPIVIFTTAYDQHALRAFEVHALDYLLKPFKPVRFRMAMKRARESITSQHAGAATRGLLDLLATGKPFEGFDSTFSERFLSRLTVKEEERVIFLKVSDIEYIESAGNYVVAKTATDTHILRETLTALSEQLDPGDFTRISRSAIVNFNFIKELTPMFKGSHQVLMQDGKSLTTTRGLRDLEAAMKFR
jgi:two-component system LytT family response regulator